MQEILKVILVTEKDYNGSWTRNLANKPYIVISGIHRLSWEPRGGKA